MHGGWVLFKREKVCVCVWCVYMNMQVPEPLCTHTGQKTKKDVLPLPYCLEAGSLTELQVCYFDEAGWSASL